MSSAVNTAPRTSAARIAGGVVLAALLAAAVNTVIALLAVAFGASDQFQPLQPATYIPLTVFGVLLGAAGWAAVRRWARLPGPVLVRLVPVVVALSLGPDFALFLTDMQPHTTTLAVIALMVMHVTTAAAALPVFARTLPLPRHDLAARS